MKPISITKRGVEFARIIPRWQGRGLAIHAPLSKGKPTRKRGQWSLTHVPSGQRAGLFNGPLKTAIDLCKKYDALFASLTPDAAPKFPYKEAWKQACREGRVICHF